MNTLHDFLLTILVGALVFGAGFVCGGVFLR